MYIPNAFPVKSDLVKIGCSSLASSAGKQMIFFLDFGNIYADLTVKVPSVVFPKLGSLHAY